MVWVSVSLGLTRGAVNSAEAVTAKRHAAAIATAGERTREGFMERSWLADSRYRLDVGCGASRLSDSRAVPQRLFDDFTVLSPSAALTQTSCRPGPSGWCWPSTSGTRSRSLVQRGWMPGIHLGRTGDRMAQALAEASSSIYGTTSQPSQIARGAHATG